MYFQDMYGGYNKLQAVFRTMAHFSPVHHVLVPNTLRQNLSARGQLHGS